MPPLPLARLYGVIAILVTYIVVRKVVQRVALELLPTDSRTLRNS
jgi:hypothetical protein